MQVGTYILTTNLKIILSVLSVFYTVKIPLIRLSCSKYDLKFDELCHSYLRKTHSLIFW